MKPDPKKIVIEYEFKQYSAPTDLEAWSVEATVTHTDIPLNLSNSLADIREELDFLGATLDGTCQPETHTRGRYNPRWREVWSILQ